MEEEVQQLTEKNKVQKKNISDSQTKYTTDTEKLRKKLSDLQSELLSKTDEVIKFALVELAKEVMKLSVFCAFIDLAPD